MNASLMWDAQEGCSCVMALLAFGPILRRILQLHSLTVRYYAVQMKLSRFSTLMMAPTPLQNWMERPSRITWQGMGQTQGLLMPF